MITRKYTIVDVYYSEAEVDAGMRERERLLKLGYELSAEDEGSGEHEYCDQYTKHNSTNGPAPGK